MNNFDMTIEPISSNSCEKLKDVKNSLRQQSRDSAADNSHLKKTAVKTYSQQTLNIQKEITALLPMVSGIANKVVTYIKAPLTFEDLVSAGTVGLVKAVTNFDSSKNANLKTYAYIRIKGSMLDELRKWTFVPSQTNKQLKQITALSQSIIESTGRIPSDDQLAEHLGINQDQLYKIFENSRAQSFCSLDSQDINNHSLTDLLDSGASGPESHLEKIELTETLTEVIQQLPEKKRQLIILYYQQNLNMKQIADLLGVTESRISQLHASAIFSLSTKLRLWKNG